MRPEEDGPARHRVVSVPSDESAECADEDDSWQRESGRAMGVRERWIDEVENGDWHSDADLHGPKLSYRIGT